MEVLTTAPGLQLYTSNFLDGSLSAKGGARYDKYAGVCLETQSFPDGPNKQGARVRVRGRAEAAAGQPESYPSGVLRPGETYRHTTIYRFSTRAPAKGAAAAAAAVPGG